MTVTAEQDDDAVDEPVVNLTHTVGSTVDTAYDGTTGGSVSVTVIDDDTVGVTVSPTAITVVGGTSNEYSVVLDTEPAGDVSVTIMGPTATGLSLDKTSLTFTTSNWSTAQTVKATALEEAASGTVTLTHTVSSSTDVEYEGVSADPVAVTILQALDELLVQVGVTASDQELTVAEGESNTYRIVLSSQPAGDVEVTIAGVTDTDLSLSAIPLTFTTSNWNTAQTVTVTADHDDDAVDDTATLTHTVSSPDDDEYDGLSAGGISVTVTDDDSVGVTISETSLDIEEGGSAAYTVMLDSEPTGSVTVTVNAPVNTDVTAEPASLTFTVDDWYTPQEVTVAVTPDGDAVDDAATVTHSVGGTDPAYAVVVVADVAVSVRDDDPTMDYALVEEEPVAEDVGTVSIGVVAVTTEAGMPSMNYAVGVQSENVTARSSRDYVGVEETLEFAAEGFQAFVDGDGETRYRQTVYFDVGIIDNEYAEQAESFILKLEPELPSDSLSVPEIEVTIVDDDFVGVTVEPTAISVAEGATATYTVVLDTRPSKNVTVTIIDPSNTEVTAEPGALTFTPSNWHVPRTVTVAADHDGDAIDEATTTITHTVSSAFEEYDDLSADNVTVTVTDDDAVGVTVTPTELTIDEGASSTYTVVLDTQPTGPVTVAIGGVAGTGLSLDRTTLTFTDQDWDTPQTVTVTADDDDDDKPVVTLMHAVTSADDTTYDGLSADSITVTVTDDDTVGVTVTPTELTIDEGASSTYTVVLDTQPTADVTVTIIEPGFPVAVAPASLTFTTQDWSTPQTVSVTAKSDYDAHDGRATITHSVTGGDYSSGVSVDPVAVTVRDDDPKMDFALLEVEPVEEDVGTVRIGIVAVTNEASIPNYGYFVSFNSLGDTAKSGVSAGHTVTTGRCL